MKSSILVVFLVVMSASILEARQFTDPNRILIKVQDTQGEVLDHATFSFDNVPVDKLSYENGAYTLDIPENVTLITIDSPGYAAINMDVAHLTSTEEVFKFIVTLQAPPKQGIPEKIVVPND